MSKRGGKAPRARKPRWGAVTRKTRKAKLLSSEVSHQGPFLRVTWDRAVDPEGHEIARAVVHHNGSAVMMPVDERGRVLLVRQFRLPADDHLWELPAGRVDPGETVLAAARRELREETGLTASRWRKLASFYVSPGFLSEKMTLYAALGLRHGEREHVEDERIEARWFDRRELESMVARGRLRDAKTLIGLLLWWQASGTSSPAPRRGGSR